MNGAHGWAIVSNNGTGEKLGKIREKKLEEGLRWGGIASAGYPHGWPMIVCVQGVWLH